MPPRHCRRRPAVRHTATSPGRLIEAIICFVMMISPSGMLLLRLGAVGGDAAIVDFVLRCFASITI